MKSSRLLLPILMFLTACLPPSTPALNPNPSIVSQSSSASSDSQATVPSDIHSDATSGHSHSDAPHVDVVDVTSLTRGDGKTSATPQRGFVFACNTRFNGGGASGTGPWINSDGTWDLTKKFTVDGTVSWLHAFTITVQRNERIFVSNNLPDHPTGEYPINPNDDAYQVDRNPNSIAAQVVNFSVPAYPSIATQPSCVGGEVGIMLSGVLIFSSFDAEGRDAAAHEVQDLCDGHPQQNSFYHYHSLSNCMTDNALGHSALAGYAFDGFGIYGFYGDDGKELTNAELDECHGHTHAIEWDGQEVAMYHYHATREFPYVIGCFKGTPAVKALTAENGAASSEQPQSQGGAGGQIPQDAINACAQLTESAACSFNSPNGPINGFCRLPPSGSQLACIPAGGPP